MTPTRPLCYGVAKAYTGGRGIPEAQSFEPRVFLEAFAGDLVRLGAYFARRYAPKRLREDAAAAFVLGAVEAVEHVDPDHPHANPRSFVVHGGVNALCDFLRRELRGPRVLSLQYEYDRHGHTLSDAVPDERVRQPHEPIADAELREAVGEAVRRAVAALPPREREAVETLELAGLTGAEAARQAGKTRQQLYLLRHKGFWRLRYRLRRLVRRLGWGTPSVNAPAAADR